MPRKLYWFFVWCAALLLAFPSRNPNNSNSTATRIRYFTRAASSTDSPLIKHTSTTDKSHQYGAVGKDWYKKCDDFITQVRRLCFQQVRSPAPKYKDSIARGETWKQMPKTNDEGNCGIIASSRGQQNSP